MNRKGLAIVRREGRLYLRSPVVWVGALVIGAVSLALLQFQSPVPLDLLLTRGEYLVVPVTLLITALVFTAGLAREERDWFEDLWNTLPVRNTTQYWGKVLGTLPAVVAFIVGLLLLIPIVWFLGEIPWTESTRQAILLHTVQGMAVIVLAVGWSALLRSAVPSFRMRGVLGVGIVILTVLSPRLFGVPWGVLLGPYVVGGVPLGFSALFGTAPWEVAVLWHLLFQVALSMTLIALASMVYKRRRDPGALFGPRAFPLLLFLSLAIVAASQYHAFWHQIFAAVAAETEYDIAAQHAQGSPVAPTVSAYDIAVHWTGESILNIRTQLHFEPDPAQRRIPFTLHHQWEVANVEGAGVLTWERAGNLLWVTVEEGLESVHLIVDYTGAPFVWDVAVYMAAPAQFILRSGGYLSPHVAWYPLPGARVLHRSDPPRSDEPRVGGRPLLDRQARFQLTWYGPEELEVITSLPHELHRSADGTRLFSGSTDGVAIFTARLERTSLGSDSMLGAPSLVRDAEPLLIVYRTLLDFYSELLGRPLPHEPILVVPSWLDRVYGMHQRRTTHALEPGRALVMPLLGERPILTEHHAGYVLARAAEWHRTKDPGLLLEASMHLHDTLEQRLWAGIHKHLPFSRSPVVVGIAEFARLQWIRHVLGEDRYREALDGVAARMEQPRAHHLRTRDEVLQQLVGLGEAKGETAVRQVLGWAYDVLQEGELEYDAFLQYLQRVR